MRALVEARDWEALDQWAAERAKVGGGVLRGWGLGDPRFSGGGPGRRGLGAGPAWPAATGW